MTEDKDREKFQADASAYAKEHVLDDIRQRTIRDMALILSAEITHKVRVRAWRFMEDPVIQRTTDPIWIVPLTVIRDPMRTALFERNL